MEQDGQGYGAKTAVCPKMFCIFLLSETWNACAREKEWKVINH